jgi:hypothetical protein
MVEQVAAPYWSPQPQHFYMPKCKKDIRAAHISIGLGDTDVVTSTMLWNLLSVTSRLPFIWESGRVKEDDCPATFPHIAEAKRDMLKYVGGILVHSTLIWDFPDFYDLMMNNNLSHLELAKYHLGQDRLKFVIRSRFIAKYGAKTMEDKAVLDIAQRGIWHGAH